MGGRRGERGWGAEEGKGGGGPKRAEEGKGGGGPKRAEEGKGGGGPKRERGGGVDLDSSEHCSFSDSFLNTILRNAGVCVCVCVCVTKEGVP